MMKSLLSLAILAPLLSFPLHAEVKTETVEYADGKVKLEGLLSQDTDFKGKRPVVVVIHDWMGVGDFVKDRTEALARMGYLAFAADIYGKDVRPKNAEEAAKTADIYKKDSVLFRKRAKAGLDWISKHALADADRIGAIGYCFGGTTVLEMARAGFPLKGVVSFHGGLTTLAPAKGGEVRAKILVLHGADDPYVPLKDVTAFEEEMRQAKTDWQLVKYSGAVHSFTNPAAGSDNSKGAAYHPAADRRSWTAMKTFFLELF